MEVKKTIGYAAAEAGLRAIVEERGEDFVYTLPDADRVSHVLRGETYYSDVCRYWHPSEFAPGCGVGAFLYREGVTPESLITLDKREDDKNASDIALIDGIEITESARELLQAFQILQDEQVPYGRALNDAISACKPKPGEEFPL